MQFRITLKSNKRNSIIPINYQFPLSSALYKVISKGDQRYAQFLHDKGYGRGFKFFTFSDIRCPFEIKGDRLLLRKEEVVLHVCFHIPEAMESFIKGLFNSKKIDISDKKSKASFKVISVESLPNSLTSYKENQIISKQLKLLSPIIAAIPNAKGHDDYLNPRDPKFIESLIYNWESKIEDCYEKEIAKNALLLIELIPLNQAFKSRLITIKAGTIEETKIRGWVNFKLKATAEKRFIELLLNSGIGLYNAQGMGAVALHGV